MQEPHPPDREVSEWGSKKSAGNDLLSPWKDYHRPQVLIGRVRNGNASFHLGKITGKLHRYRCNLVGYEAWLSGAESNKKTMWPNDWLLVPVS